MKNKLKLFKEIYDKLGTGEATIDDFYKAGFDDEDILMLGMPDSTKVKEDPREKALFSRVIQERRKLGRDLTKEEAWVLVKENIPEVTYEDFLEKRWHKK